MSLFLFWRGPKWEGGFKRRGEGNTDTLSGGRQNVGGNGKVSEEEVEEERRGGVCASPVVRYKPFVQILSSGHPPCSWSRQRVT